MRLLHLVGATTTQFYHDLSATYHAATLTPAGMRADVLRVTPEGKLFLRKADQEAEAPCGLDAVVALCDTVDLVVPFMFCPPGMTVWRDFFETMLGVPVIGPSLAANVISTSKWQTKAVADAAGVRTARAHRLTQGDPLPDWSGPCIVKPDTEDNSIGLSLVKHPEDLAQAVQTALGHDTTALIEAFVPGREVRVGVLELEARPQVLPILEYHVSDAHPIRRREDKVDVDSSGAITKRSWDAPSLETTCPAPLDDALREELSQMALTLHAALGCRDYALFDFRIHADTGTPYLLEACSFWTFAPISILSRMVTAAGMDLEETIARLYTRAAAR
ncbi:hypothetical protein KDD17_06195 [Sulfitobacter albidus]|uniref:ATP-grasp domain-containing protein n=1 Tax=Sulfitobacter albidus TaxID=2829501 RepID=A0A975JG37_9RHOB|nr:hypothetical protein [Sulfitobacter albidus]QUJ77561.1 hypothetical protein KDD17_06195 [Sulfitobacter albidus]